MQLNDMRFSARKYAWLVNATIKFNSYVINCHHCDNTFHRSYTVNVIIIFIYKVVLARSQWRDLWGFESSYHLPTRLPQTVEASSLSLFNAGRQAGKLCIVQGTAAMIQIRESMLEDTPNDWFFLLLEALTYEIPFLDNLTIFTYKYDFVDE